MPARDAWKNADEVAAGAIARGTSVIYEYEHPPEEQQIPDAHATIAEIGRLPIQRTIVIDLDSSSEVA